jgi:hypothetical protein
MKKYLIFCVLLFIAAAALRFYNLGSTCLWIDEVLTANLARGSFQQMVETLRTGHSAPILFPTLLWLNQGMVSDPFWVRVWSVIFGLGAIVALLCLPAAGIPKRVAAFSAILMAFSGSQIQYSQEVREYMMGVFFSALLLLLFLLQSKRNCGLMSYLSFSLVLLISPFVTYGLVPLSMVLIGFYALHILLHDRKMFWRPVVLSIGFLVSLRICFLLTIVYQQWLANFSLYNSLYPPGGFSSSIAWLISSVSEFVNFPLGFSGGLILILMWFVSIFVIQRETNQEPESGPSKKIGVLFGSLLLFMLLLAFLHRYPFGGTRHLLFASPFVIVCFALAFDFFLSKWKGLSPISYWIVPLFVVLLQFNNLKPAYEDVIDVASPLEFKPADMQDQNVFIDSWGVPGVEYHFPRREFTKTKYQTHQLGEIVEEINALPGNSRLVILFDRPLEEVWKISDMLNRTNGKVETLKRYKEGAPKQSFVFLVTR